MRETTGYKVFRATGLAFITLLTAAPLYIIVSSSLKPLVDVRGDFSWWPTTLTFAAYGEMWSTIPLARYLTNSLIVSLSATAASLLVATFAAYAVARLHFRGSRSFSLLVLSTQMFPGILFLLPLFLIFVQIQTRLGLQLTGTYTGLIVTYMTFSLPFSIWMLVGYFASLPRELEEAALIDGSGPVGALFRVVLPVARPGIIAVGVFAFTTAWSEVLFASVLTDQGTRTLAVGLQAFASQSSVLWNQLMAASVVISIPVLVGFLALQRYLVTGLSAGAVK